MAEMPSLAAVVAEAYRNKLIDDNQALAAMKLSEKDINEWIKTNKKLNKLKLYEWSLVMISLTDLQACLLPTNLPSFLVKTCPVSGQI